MEFRAASRIMWEAYKRSPYGFIRQLREGVFKETTEVAISYKTREGGNAQ